VLGVDRKVIPARMWMRAEDVVARSLAGLERGELFVVPGWRYKLVVWLVPALPRFLRHRLLIYYGRRARREMATD
jgi:short-subunit dehydrogenase